MDRIDQALEDFIPGKKSQSDSRQHSGRTRHVRSTPYQPYQRQKPNNNNSRRDVNGSWDHDMADRSNLEPRTRGSHAHPSRESSNTLVIKNIHYEITELQLKNLFENSGFAASDMVKLPKIKWDAAGRSTGIATVSFEDARDAVAARKVLNGKTALDQELSVEFGPSTKTHRSSVSSLLDRIHVEDKSALLNRVSSRRLESPPRYAPTGPNERRNAERGQPRRPARDQRTREGRDSKPRIKTAEDLDNELSSFMGVSSTTAPAPGQSALGTSALDGSSVEVEMS